MSKDLSQEIHDKAAPFLTWLKEAEEEESESDEEDDDLEVGDINDELYMCMLYILFSLSYFDSEWFVYLFRLNTMIVQNSHLNHSNHHLLQRNLLKMILMKRVISISMPFKKENMLCCRT